MSLPILSLSAGVRVTSESQAPSILQAFAMLPLKEVEWMLGVEGALGSKKTPSLTCLVTDTPCDNPNDRQVQGNSWWLGRIRWSWSHELTPS